MSIELHCEHCGKLVRAPEDAAGKHGVCPSCHQSVYIPTPSERIEPLGLAPVDVAAERERERLLKETHEIQKRLMNDRDLPREAVDFGGARAPAGQGGPRPAPQPQKIAAAEIEKLVVAYAVAMADGKLEDAEEIANQLRRHMAQTEEIVQRFTFDEILPEPLAKLPRPVMIGFFKQLRGG